MRPLSPRDSEILRTLLRVQLASTASLARTFFPDLRGAQRRLRTLRIDYGYVAVHSKGLPGNYAREGGHYWRLTEAGMRQICELFPAEWLPPNHIRRSRTASLRYFEHRDAMTDVYLGLIESQERDMDQLTRRADEIHWLGEHNVILDYQTVEGASYRARQVIPDATLTTSAARYFLEVDRSTETRSYCRKTLQNYASAIEQQAYRARFGDDKEPIVVYITKSEARAKSLMDVAASLPHLSLQAIALPFDDALRFLSGVLDGDPHVTPPPPVSASDVAALLTDLYADYRNDIEARQATGQPIEAPASMTNAYTFLQAWHAGRSA